MSVESLKAKAVEAIRLLGSALIFWAAMVAVGAAQSSSLYGPPGLRPPITLEESSFYFIKVPPPEQLELNDIVTVIVDEKRELITEGEVDQRQQASFDARLQDWLELDGFGVTPAPQPNGDPRIRASLNKQNRAEAGVETFEALKFRIAARIVDVRPNGTLVIEARRTIRNNEEEWEQALTGIIRREDVLPNNTVLSEDVADLRIVKREKGHVRDGYRRGWLFRLIDKYKAF